MERLKFEFANFLIASWRLAQPRCNLPTGHEKLDRGLEAVRERVPDQFQPCLFFGNSILGRVCHSLPSILQAAAESYLIQPVSPGFLSHRVMIDVSRAMDMLDDLEIEIEQAKAFGQKLAAVMAFEKVTF